MATDIPAENSANKDSSQKIGNSTTEDTAMTCNISAEDLQEEEAVVVSKTPSGDLADEEAVVAVKLEKQESVLSSVEGSKIENSVKKEGVSRAESLDEFRLALVEAFNKVGDDVGDGKDTPAPVEEDHIKPEAKLTVSSTPSFGFTPDIEAEVTTEVSGEEAGGNNSCEKYDDDTVSVVADSHNKETSNNSSPEPTSSQPIDQSEQPNGLTIDDVTTDSTHVDLPVTDSTLYNDHGSSKAQEDTTPSTTGDPETNNNDKHESVSRYELMQCL